MLSEKQYVYNIGYGSYEESDFAQLLHTKKFSNARLRKLVEAAILRIVARTRRKGRRKRKRNSYQNIHDQVVERLVSHDGFVRLEFTAEWACFGWGSIFDNCNRNKNRDPNLQSLTRAINRAGYYEKPELE